MLSESEALLYWFLNVFFFAIHFILIVFNLFGWIFPRFRRLHLISIGITAFSWLILGAFYGWGYCFLTDWHYQIRNDLGLSVDSPSYIHFLLLRLGIDSISSETTNIVTAVVFGGLVVISILFNVKSVLKNKVEE